MILSEGPQNSDDLIITDDFTCKQMFLKRSESKSLTDSNWPSSISVLLGRSLSVNYLCLPQKRFYIMTKLGFCFILEKYKFMQWMGWYSKWPQGFRICGLINHLWWSTRHSRGFCRLNHHLCYLSHLLCIPNLAQIWTMTEDCAGNWGRTQPISCKQKLFEKEVDSGILGGTCYNPADDSEHILEGRGCHVADAKLRLGGQCQHGPWLKHC